MNTPNVLPLLAEHVQCVRDFGMTKYPGDPNNWRSVPPIKSLASLKRHIEAFENGETYDRESKLPHLAHAACRIMFLLAQTTPFTDDELIHHAVNEQKVQSEFPPSELRV